MKKKNKKHKNFFREGGVSFLLLSFVFLHFSQPAHAWPWDNTGTKKSADKKEQAEQTKQTPPLDSKAAVKKDAAKAKGHPKSAASEPSASPAAEAEPGTDQSIAQVQSEIQHILQLNEMLKLQHQDQAAEIQRISEQAQIHQRILNSLQAAPKPVAPALANTDAGELIKQEKIRLIQQETLKNSQIVENLNRVKKVPNQ